jgi:cysteine desulfurase
MSRIYFDNAASTPLDPRVLEAMQPYFLEEFGNPGSLHSFGQKAIAAVDASREKIGALIGASHFREVIFTGSATEANNLAVRGAVEFFKKNEPSKRPRVIISSIEHESIMETARSLESWGAEVIYLPVTQEGIVDLEELKDSINDATVLVSVMCVNNETGIVQPLAEIKKIIADVKTQHGGGRYPLFHTDAAQAFQFFDCNVAALGVDMMTLSAHKIYGPKGTGVLYVRRGSHAGADLFPLLPQTSGGGQEFGLRSGTENVPNIVGFAEAMGIAAEKRKERSDYMRALRHRLWEGIKKIMPTAEMNGTSAVSAAVHGNAPHILSVYFPGHLAQDLLIRFDRAGLATSSGSACRSRAIESSYVIEALGYSKERASSTIRFSLGKENTEKEVQEALFIIERAI